MKLFLFNILTFAYPFFAVMILCSAILFPFSIHMKDSQNWLAWIIYPLCIIIIASRDQVDRYLDEKEKELKNN
jgi:hypothetical protein